MCVNEYLYACVTGQNQSEADLKGPTVEALQKKIRKLEAELEKRGVPDPTKRKNLNDDKVKVTR